MSALASLEKLGAALPKGFMTISRIFLGGLLGLFWFLSAWAQDTTILAASAPLNMPQAIAVDTAGNSLYRDQGRSGHERRRAVEASAQSHSDDAGRRAAPHQI